MRQGDRTPHEAGRQDPTTRQGDRTPQPGRETGPHNQAGRQDPTAGRETGPHTSSYVSWRLTSQDSRYKTRFETRVTRLALRDSRYETRVTRLALRDSRYETHDTRRVLRLALRDSRYETHDTRLARVISAGGQSVCRTPSRSLGDASYLTRGPWHRGSYRMRIYDRENIMGQMMEMTDDCDFFTDHYRCSGGCMSCRVMDEHCLVYEHSHYRGRMWNFSPGENRNFRNWGGMNFVRMRCIMDSCLDRRGKEGRGRKSPAHKAGSWLASARTLFMQEHREPIRKRQADRGYMSALHYGRARQDLLPSSVRVWGEKYIRSSRGCPHTGGTSPADPRNIIGHLRLEKYSPGKSYDTTQDPRAPRRPLEDLNSKEKQLVYVSTQHPWPLVAMARTLHLTHTSLSRLTLHNRDKYLYAERGSYHGRGRRAQK
ncbi:hypothetical protein P4O66_001922 [Electrophorus voltai]|uniref:Beta/gamma crystallin 'Greek key' domain-containing protein n=1 Tax=Electrophorus voltai TaxID=2609070 RepID=A0AAD8Z5Y2_9TELE|nr:hypothetical protein P4O66_001922 [Electrophorus voltai]